LDCSSVILCERAIIEEQSKALSLVCLVENITLPAPPPELKVDGKQIAVPFRFYVVQQWSRTKLAVKEAAEGRVLFKGPNGKQFGSVGFVIELRKTPRARVISQSFGFPLVGAGAYKCIVQLKGSKNWRTLQEAEFNVIFGDPGEVHAGVTRH
jgi:hypothetical protein